jgi:hypothetical protein
VREQLAPEPSTPLDWALLYRRAEQQLRMRRWEIGRYTLSQLLNALDRSDPDDPHAGGLPLTSLSQLDDLV